MRSGRHSTSLFAVTFVLLILGAGVGAQPSDIEVLPNGEKSDGCTLIPDTHIKPCCLVHDQEYYRGGTRDERRESDKKLYNCVKKKKGLQHRIFAPFIWLGVRIGGLPFLPTRFRWGFGTNEKRYSKKQAEQTEDDKP